MHSLTLGPYDGAQVAVDSFTALAQPVEGEDTVPCSQVVIQVPSDASVSLHVRDPDDTETVHVIPAGEHRAFRTQDLADVFVASADGATTINPRIMYFEE